MGVPLEHHQLLDLLGAEGDDAPDVVAGEVDEHHVLGALLRVLGELGGHAAVVGIGAAATAGPGDRPADDPAVEQLDHRLGRRADERRLRVTHEVHVGRRVDLAQHAVHVERVDRIGEIEPLREHDLEDVAGEDVLARHLDRVVVARALHRRVHDRDLGELAGRWRRGDVREGSGQLVDPAAQARDRVVVRDVDARLAPRRARRGTRSR